MSPTLIWPYTQLPVPLTSLLQKESSYKKSIHPALSNHRNLGILHSHTPLDLTLLSHRKRVIDHNQSFNLRELTNRRKQLLLYRDRIQTSIREAITPSQNRRSRDCIQVSVAQSLLSNRRKLDRLHTEWRIFTHRIPYTGGPRNSRTPRSSTPSITNSRDTGTTWYRRIQP